MIQLFVGNPPDIVLSVEAFGRQMLPQEANHPINANDEDLLSVFRARSMLMSWHATMMGHDRFMAWDVHEAEHIPDADANDPMSLIGFVQVGLRADPNEVVLRLPAVVQCLHDSLDRFGRVDLSAVLITATSLPGGAPDRRAAFDLIGATNWFNDANDSPTQALVVFGDRSLPVDRPDVFAPIRWLASQPFAFGALTAVPNAHQINAISAQGLQPLLTNVGLPVTMPNWTPGAIGWVLATVLHAVHTASPGLRGITLGIIKS